MPQAAAPSHPASEPFVPSSDRPEIKPDARVADLTVRDLLSVLSSNATTLKPNTADLKVHHDIFKTHLTKFEYAKYEYWKLENLKAEIDYFNVPPVGPVGPGPEFSQIAQGIAGLRAQVDLLSSEVAELRNAKR